MEKNEWNKNLVFWKKLNEIDKPQARMIKKKKKEQTKLPILGMREHYYRIKKKKECYE